MKFLVFTLILISSSLAWAKPSLEERQELKYQITLGIFSEYTQIDSTTLSAGYFLSPDEIIQLRFTAAHHTARDDAKRGLYSTDIEVLTAGYRKFFGNSFNIMPSLYLRNLSEDRANTTHKPDLKITDFGLGMRIGNQWQTDYFTYGCDWFGINSMLLRFNEINHVGSRDYQFSLTFLSLYIGASF
jgi:hypothetical protein